jgi:hypothetical protein
MGTGAIGPHRLGLGVTMPEPPPPQLRCPTCGAELVDVDYDVSSEQDALQDPTNREVTTYRCGHTVVGEKLAEADPELLDVEQRTSDETIDES